MILAPLVKRIPVNTAEVVKRFCFCLPAYSKIAMRTVFIRNADNPHDFSPSVLNSAYRLWLISALRLEYVKLVRLFIASASPATPICATMGNL